MEKLVGEWLSMAHYRGVELWRTTMARVLAPECKVFQTLHDISVESYSVTTRADRDVSFKFREAT